MTEIKARKVILRDKEGKFIIPYTIPYTAGDGVEITDNVISTTEPADLKSIFDLIYPVGSIYMSVNAVNPATLFGIGTWEQIKDMFLLASGDTYKNKATGGEATHTITTSEMPSHTHTQASCTTAGAHTHTRGTMDISGSFTGDHNENKNLIVWSHSGAFYNSKGSYKSDRTLFKAAGSGVNEEYINFQASRNWTGETSSNGNHTHNTTLNNTGSGTAHNNMPPYLAVNVWKRTA